MDKPEYEDEEAGMRYRILVILIMSVLVIMFIWAILYIAIK